MQRIISPRGLIKDTFFLYIYNWWHLVVNGGIGCFINYFQSYLFLFIVPAVYSLFCSGVLDCSSAIHQGTAFHYLVQSAETEKGFWGGVAHSSSTNSPSLLNKDVPRIFHLMTWISGHKLKLCYNFL